MELRNLKEVGLDQIVECLLESFKNYFVPMPSNLSYWETRYKGARVNYELSYGAFEKDRLVGFIINGIGEVEGQLTAFNTGTGVIEEYRGQQLVDQLYKYSFPYLLTAGIERCELEVIQANKRAIRVYERIGFDVKRKLKCYKGELKEESNNLELKEVNFEHKKQIDNKYSWDHKNKTIKLLKDKYETYEVLKGERQPIGYFVINKEYNYLAQIESTTNNYTEILKGVSKLSKEIRIINVDEKLDKRIKDFEEYGLINTLDQYEMEMRINLKN